MATYCVLRRLVGLQRNCQSILFLRQAPGQGFHTSTQVSVNRRKDRAVIKHLYYKNHEKTLSHAYSPLVELPDYTYLDGRPTEITLSGKNKQMKNYNLAKQVVKLVKEVKLAQNEYAAQQYAAENYEQSRQNSQLKEKGHKS